MKTVLIGGGGHAAVVMDAARLSGKFDFVGILDQDLSKRGSTTLGLPIIGCDDDMPRLRREGVEGFFVSVGGMPGVLQRRAKLFSAGLAAGLIPVSIIHPAATVAHSASVAGGVAIMARVIVNVDASVEANAILNTGSTIEHHCRVGAHSHIATGALLCGGVQVGQVAFIGAGAIVREGRKIGDNSMVGMGAVVVGDVDAGLKVVGNPARVQRSGS